MFVQEIARISTVLKSIAPGAACQFYSIITGLELL